MLIPRQHVLRQSLAEGLFGEAPGSVPTDSAVNLARDKFTQFLAPIQDTFNEQQAKVGPLNDKVASNIGSSLDIAKSDFERYNALYKPLEDQTISDAKTYDSPAELERVRAEAAGNANTALDTADESRRIELQRRGVNPGSKAFTTPDSSVSLTRAAAVADSMNRATAGRKDAAIALRSGVAGFGRSTLSSGINTTNAALPYTGTPSSWASLGVGTTGALGNLGVGATSLAQKSEELSDSEQKWRAGLQLTGIGSLAKAAGSIIGGL